MQAARFLQESNHQRKVQLFFTITLALLEHQILMVKQKCTPAALAADPKTDVEVMFKRITNAIKVCAVRAAVASCVVIDSIIVSMAPEDTAAQSRSISLCCAAKNSSSAVSL